MKKAIVTSWKTTIGGIVAGLPFVITGVLNSISQGAFNGQGKYQIMAGIGLIIMGAFAKDHDVTGNPPVKIEDANVTNTNTTNP